MKMSIPGLTLAVVLYSVIFTVFTFFSIGCHQYTRDYYGMLDETRNFVDKVRDTHEVTDVMLEGYNYDLASHGIMFRAEILREIKVINPDPVNPGKTVTSYVISDNWRSFNTGDFVTVNVAPVSHNLYQALASVFMRLTPNDASFTKSGMVGR